MKRVLIAYFSAGGTTEKMAGYIAEGVRFSGREATVKKIEDLSDASELAGYDGYIFGSPTYSLDVPEPMQRFLSTAQQARLEGKLGGAFGSYTHDVGYQHDAHAPAIILDTMQNVHRMKSFELGPFNLNEASIDTVEGMKTCQDYGRVFGEKLGS
jgi:flavodoxin